MRLRRMITAAALTVAAGAAMTAVTAAPASAGDVVVYTMETDDGNPGGIVWFYPYGDSVKLCDIQADGYHVELLVRDTTQDIYKYTLTASGNGNCSYARAADSDPNHDLREGNHFLFRICLRDGSGPLQYCDYADWVNDNPS